MTEELGLSADAWIQYGDNPYYLMFVVPVPHSNDEVINIDLDKPGWLAEYGHLFRTPCEFYLVRKVSHVVAFSVHLNEGDQGYYTARHVGYASSDNNAETTAYGIGKKRYDGNEDNLWVLPWGQVCGGNDVEFFALKGLRGGLARL